MRLPTMMAAAVLLLSGCFGSTHLFGDPLAIHRNVPQTCEGLLAEAEGQVDQFVVNQAGELARDTLTNPGLVGLAVALGYVPPVAAAVLPVAYLLDFGGEEVARIDVLMAEYRRRDCPPLVS